MLSLGKLAPGQQQYYLETVARGAEEYYTGAKEAPGQWCGSAAKQLGLEGEVGAVALGRVLGHDHPTTGEHLTKSRSHPVVAGFDATFSAAKSVSLLFALGDPETSNEVRNGHDAAVADALAFLEGKASVGRRGRGGAALVAGDGFVAAAFRHRTSRAADPQLHTHVVVANLVHSPDDLRWTALDARPLYRWCRPAGHLYEAQLRWELTSRLGVDWEPVVNGIADITGVSAAAIEAFSTRRHEILAHLDSHGTTSGRSAQIAAYATRKSKDPNATPDSLVDTWRAKAGEHGLDPATLTAVLRRGNATAVPAVGSVDAERLFEHLAAPDGLTARRSTFGPGSVIEAICDRLPDGGRVADIVALADAFVASAHVVPVHDVVPGDLDLADRWTTPEMLATEARLLALVDTSRRARTGTAPHDTVEEALRSRPNLDADQAGMVRRLCSSGAGIDVVEGVAGAGKTYALAAAHAAWTASGRRVRGACLAARAAQQLEDGSGIPSSTIDRLERTLRHDPLTATDVVVIDEAGMVGTRSMLRLAEHCQTAGAKLVLIGDPRQLPEIDAGGAFGHLTQRHEGARLDTNRRQTEGWERAALAELRHGDTDLAYAAYDKHGRIHTGPDVRGQLVNAWFDARRHGEDALMVAGHLRAVDDLNRRTREQLQAEGAVGPDVLRAGTRWFAVGDEVLALRNDYAIGVLNGTRGTIESFDRRAETLTIRIDARTQIEIPIAYVGAGDLTHGYATTIHKSQGSTVDRCLVLIEQTTNREQAYTALSRGRLANHAFIEQAGDRADDAHVQKVEPDVLDRLRRDLGRSVAQQLAGDQMDRAGEAAHRGPELGR